MTFLCGLLAGGQALALKESHYWDTVAEAWGKTRPQTLWRTHSDAVHLQLCARWLPEGRVERLLKTDVFEEACGNGLYSLLASKAERVVGMDLSCSTLSLARTRHAGLCAIRADTRRLPFADGVFDVIVSTSTLDHFRSRSELVASLRELLRVLRPDGQLLLTLDNPVNPLVGLRNALPFGLLHRLRLVPYYVGVTCGPRGLRRLLPQMGFEVLEVTTVLHCPRLFAVATARMLEGRVGRETQKRFLGLLATFERLARWPTRFVTGYFIAVRARKR
jgi:SAM-dependent methyltransferase